MKTALACIVLVLSGCADFPRDPDGTSQRIARDGTIRVGMVSDDTAFANAASGRFLRRLARQTRARPHLVPGATERLLQRLEKGELDLVLAPLDPQSPWVTRVTLGPPIADQGVKDGRIEYHAVMRNGENRWIMTVEKAIRATAQPGAAS